MGGEDYPDTPSNYEELEGECVYKSGWVEVNWPGGLLSFTAAKGPKHCWLRFTGWSAYLYTHCQWWYNWKRSGNPDEDASFLKNMADNLPDFKMPDLPGLPSMPDLSMPDLSMPDVSMPSVSMPSVSMPSMSMPSFKKPKMPKKKKFREDYMIYFNINDKGTVKKSGKDITMKVEEATLNYDGEADEKKKNYILKFQATSSDQAESWFETMKGAGLKEA